MNSPGSRQIKWWGKRRKGRRGTIKAVPKSIGIKGWREGGGPSTRRPRRHGYPPFPAGILMEICRGAWLRGCGARSPPRSPWRCCRCAAIPAEICSSPEGLSPIPPRALRLGLGVRLGRTDGKQGGTKGKKIIILDDAPRAGLEPKAEGPKGWGSQTSSARVARGRWEGGC